MKKKLKYFGIIFLIASFCTVFLFIYKLDDVKIDKRIKAEVIQELKTKKYLSFSHFGKKQVSTDLSLVENDTDTVYWQCNIREWEKLKSIQEINFHIGDGYSGTNINIIRLSTKYKVFIKDYNDDHHVPQKKYCIENPNLILDKKNYIKGDSIYGKIDFTIKEEIDRESSVYHVRGHFKSKIN
ncbi:hypothetical protein [Chryseobacterium sp. AG844]|uniref:hypothetical protein n=1 Tax=Chryseobacterium sp. AG844 TaxID=2183998 RepID=UPI000D716EDB|nr:hypothetical protein [Chryseobacterium sp. AG844]PWW29949.1 hypothetical protein DEU40_102193 [Chryseobacterium sp. AG844]